MCATSFVSRMNTIVLPSGDHVWIALVTGIAGESLTPPSVRRNHVNVSVSSGWRGVHDKFAVGRHRRPTADKGPSTGIPSPASGLRFADRPHEARIGNARKKTKKLLCRSKECDMDSNPLYHGHGVPGVVPRWHPPGVSGMYDPAVHITTIMAAAATWHSAGVGEFEQVPVVSKAGIATVPGVPNALIAAPHSTESQ